MKNIEILERLIQIQRQIDLNETEDNLNDEYLETIKLEFNSLCSKIKKYFAFLEYETPQDIIDIMIKKYNLPEDFATNKVRKRDSYVYPRQRAMTISRHIFNKLSLANIGMYFGNKKHDTVLHSIKSVKNLCKTDKQYRKEFEEMQLYFLGNIEIDY